MIAHCLHRMKRGVVTLPPFQPAADSHRFVASTAQWTINRRSCPIGNRSGTFPTAEASDRLTRGVTQTDANYRLIEADLLGREHPQTPSPALPPLRILQSAVARLTLR